MFRQKSVFTWPKALLLLIVASVSLSAKAQDNDSSKEEVFVMVEEMPQFPGGMVAMRDYLINNIEYPALALENRVEGRVVVSIVVDATGKVGQLSVIRSVSPELDAEAIRLVQAMPNWIPGKQQGRAVSVRMSVPISFKLPKQLPQDTLQLPEVMPQFPGGVDALRDFLVSNINYPSESLRNKVQGKVEVSFVVDTLGKVGQLSLLSSASPELDAEAMRVVQSMPDWTPGMQNGVPMSVRLSLPIEFELPKTPINEMPQFPGGEDALNKYFKDNLKYSQDAVKDGNKRVFVSFMVDEHGGITNVENLNNVSPELNAEAIRVVKNMPNWIPGMIGGSPASMPYNVPVVFESSESSGEAFDAAEVDQLPCFRGGEVAMQKYIRNNLRYPEEALANGEQGRVIVSFVIDGDGKVTNVENINYVSPALNAEAVRVVKSMPKWIPGKLKDGKSVRVKYSLPLVFRLNLDNELVNNELPKTPQEDSAPVIVEQMPQFPGGEKAMKKFINKNLRYPKESLKKGTSGRVIVTFVVDTDGKVCDAEVLRSVHPLLDAEAVRLVQSMPDWTPGMQDGKPVRVKYTLPIAFGL